MKQYITYSITIAVFLMLSSCGKQPVNSDTQQDGASRKNVQVNEAWESVWDENDNVDSPAFWHSPDGVHLVIATAKSTDRLLVYEAASGKLLYSIGSGGSNAGEFRRPNGIAIMDNYAIIVERDNRRVQVFRLRNLSIRMRHFFCSLSSFCCGVSWYQTDGMQTASEKESGLTPRY